ncbi:MAG TPA: rhomboid family intramembrane serine protease [Saprospiraceae bacterium]|nr:rhomboid family intramembrane serine protease [Saprospiraceae bacterium]
MMPITPIVKNLLIINVIVFIAIKLLPPGWGDMLTFYSPVADPDFLLVLQRDRPDLVSFFNEHYGLFRPFQIISYMFTHADVGHIFFNMLSLYFMGPSVEIALGPKRFLGLYMISGLVALAAHFLVYYFPYLIGHSEVMPFFAVLGASGAVFGVVIAFATLYPDRELMLLFPPIPIKAWIMALILVGIGLYQGLTGSGGNVAHFAHLGGALAGYILARHWKHGGRFLK